MLTYAATIRMSTRRSSLSVALMMFLLMQLNGCNREAWGKGQIEKFFVRRIERYTRGYTDTKQAPSHNDSGLF